MRQLILLLAVAVLGCGTSTEAGTPDGAAKAEKKDRDPMVGYDLRRLRPRDGEPLKEMFERVRERAVGEGKQVAVLFSADWCEQCRIIDLELGNMHPESLLSHVRILELKEEDWEEVTRMNEFNNLRRRWSAPLNVYPLFVLLDEDGEKVEDMDEAKQRLKDMGVEPTLVNWLDSVRTS
jgi:thiol-disulfide isomerase/thioredoxin